LDQVHQSEVAEDLLQALHLDRRSLGKLIEADH
jgi:hypothetical protein